MTPMTRALLLVLLLAPSVCSAEWSIMNRLPFDANMIEPEVLWIQEDPNLCASLVDVYTGDSGLPYLELIRANWLEYNPLICGGIPRTYNKVKITPRVCYRGLHGRGTDYQPLELGNLNGDDAIDGADFAIYAAHYRGDQVRINWPDTPRKPRHKPVVEAPEMSPMEVMAWLAATTAGSPPTASRSTVNGTSF